MFYADLTPCHHTCITFPTRAGKKNHIQISNVHFYMRAYRKVVQVWWQGVKTSLLHNAWMVAEHAERGRLLK